jgi:hypothetical protein
MRDLLRAQLLFAGLSTMGYALAGEQIPVGKHARHHIEIDGAGASLRREPGIGRFAEGHATNRGTARISALDLSSDTAMEKPEPLGTIALLVNSSDPAEMAALEDNLVPSLLRFLKFRTPAMVFYSGPQAPVQSATIQLRLNPLMSLSLVDVTTRVEQFAKKHVVKHVVPNRARWKLAEFWAMHMHLLPELQKFRYMWHLSPRSVLLSDVTANLYEVMHQKKARVGYRMLKHSKPDSCAGLPAAAGQFFENNAVWAPSTIPTRAFLEMYQEAKCPLWSSDFEIMDLDYFRNSEAYGPYVRYLADRGGFAKYGWGEHVVQTLFLGTQAGPERLLCMTPWVPIFKGRSTIDCDDGMGLHNLFQDSVRQYLEEPVEVLQVKDLTPNATRSQNSELGKTSKIRSSHHGIHRVMALVSRHVATTGVSVLLAVLLLGVAYKRGQLTGKSDEPDRA